MRIFYAAHDSGNGGVPGSRTWYYNLYLPLIDLGNDVIRFNYNLDPHLANADLLNPIHNKFIQEHRPILEHELLKQVEQAHHEKPIDIFFSYFYSAFVTPETIQYIRNLGIVTVNWYCNASYQFNLVQDIAPAFDYCLVPEKFRLEDYRRVGANPIYCQEAANPDIYKPSPLLQEFDVTFIGARYADRYEYIQRLIEVGINVHVWGPGWVPNSITPKSLIHKIKKLGPLEMLIRAIKKTKGLPKAQVKNSIFLSNPGIFGHPLLDNELIPMYSRSKISLGFSTCGETQNMSERIVQIRLRDFEAPMSGAFYLVEFMPELEEFFEIGKEIACYTNVIDLIDKCKYYLLHESEREEIRWAGYHRAISDHTWQKRFKMVFETIQSTQNKNS